MQLLSEYAAIHEHVVWTHVKACRFCNRISVHQPSLSAISYYPLRRDSRPFADSLLSDCLCKMNGPNKGNQVGYVKSNVACPKSVDQVLRQEPDVSAQGSHILTGRQPTMPTEHSAWSILAAVDQLRSSLRKMIHKSSDRQQCKVIVYIHQQRMLCMRIVRYPR